MTEFISRKEASALGLKKYYNGKPCARGHYAERYVNGGCSQCYRENMQKRYHADPELAKQKLYAFRKANPEVCREIQNNYYARNSAKIRAEQTAIRAARLKRVPPWADLGLIACFYELCPPDKQVDHEIPLQGKFVSGLHVIENLQYLTESENKAKKNKIDLQQFNAVEYKS